MQSTGQTVAQDWQLVHESLLMTLMYRVSFFRSSLRVWKYSVTRMVMTGGSDGGRRPGPGAPVPWDQKDTTPAHRTPSVAARVAEFGNCGEISANCYSLSRCDSDSTGRCHVKETYADLAKMIDHSLLNPTLKLADLRAGCELAVAYDVASVCIMPYALKRCVEWLAGSTVQPSHDNWVPSWRSLHRDQAGRGDAGDLGGVPGTRHGWSTSAGS